jgi:hypothetical protein
LFFIESETVALENCVGGLNILHGMSLLYTINSLIGQRSCWRWKTLFDIPIQNPFSKKIVLYTNRLKRVTLQCIILKGYGPSSWKPYCGRLGVTKNKHQNMESSRNRDKYTRILQQGTTNVRDMSLLL